MSNVNEQELREQIEKSKKLLRYSALIYTPVVVVVIWLLDPPMWWLIAGLLVIFELISFPFITKALDRTTEARIEQLRGEQHSGSDSPKT